MPEVRYLKAVNQALYDAMEVDDSVFVIGEDVAAAGLSKRHVGCLRRLVLEECMTRLLLKR